MRHTREYSSYLAHRKDYPRLITGDESTADRNLSVSLQKRFCEESAMPQEVVRAITILPELVHQFTIPV